MLKKTINISSILVMMVIFGSSVSKFSDMGNTKALFYLLSLPFFLFFILFIIKYGTRIILYSFMFYWLPLPSLLNSFPALTWHYFFEFLIDIAFFAFLFIDLFSRKGHIKFLTKFPYLPFSIYIIGAIVAYLVSYKTPLIPSVIRLLCFFPLALGYVITHLVRSVNQAKLLLWVLLFSSALLALLVLFGSTLFPAVIHPYSYANGMGRLSMEMSLPGMGLLQIDPAGIGDKFAFLLTISFAFWLSYPTQKGRIIASFMCIIFGTVIILAQGRAGIGAVILSTSVITVYNIIKERSSRISNLFKLSAVLIIVIGFTLYLATVSAPTDRGNFSQRIFGLFSDPLTDEQMEFRTQYWKIGFPESFNNPLGVGLYGFPQSGMDTWIVHNLLLYLSLSFGMIGLSGFILIFLRFGQVFLGGLRKISPDQRFLSIIGIGCLVCLIVGGFFSGVMYNPYEIVIVWSPLFAIFAVVKPTQVPNHIINNSCD